MQFFAFQDEFVSPIAGGDPLARVSWLNPLSVSPEAVGELGRGERLVMFSGWFDDDGAAVPREGIFPGDFRTWTPAAWAKLDAFCDGLRSRLEACGGRVWFRPHARHVLADPQACLSFIRRREGEPFDVLLDAAAFLTPDMLDRAEDHLTRGWEALAGQERVSAAVLSNVVPAGEGLVGAPVTAGKLDSELIAGLARRYGTHLPWILLPEDLSAQVALLSGEEQHRGSEGV